MDVLLLMGYTSEQAEVIIDVANQIGASPIELARFVDRLNASLSPEELIKELSFEEVKLVPNPSSLDLSYAPGEGRKRKGRRRGNKHINHYTK